MGLMGGGARSAVEGSAFPTGTEPMSLSTLCSSTKLICLKETVVSSGESRCHLTFSSCSVIVVCVKQEHLMAGREAEFVRLESDNLCLQLGNPRFTKESEGKIREQN